MCALNTCRAQETISAAEARAELVAMGVMAIAATGGRSLGSRGSSCERHRPRRLHEMVPFLFASGSWRASTAIAVM